MCTILFAAQLTTHQLPLDCHQSQTDTQLLSNNQKEIAYHISHSPDEQVSHESQEVEYHIPTETDTNPTQTSVQQHLISAHQISGDQPAQWCPVKTDHTSVDTADVICKASWSASHKPEVVLDKQEVIKTIKHQIFTDTAEKSTPQLAQAQHPIMTKSPKTEYRSLSSFQLTQENANKPLHNTQTSSVEFERQVMIKAQETPEQLQAQTQLRSQQVSTEKKISLQEANLLQIQHQTAHELLNGGAHEVQKIEGESQGYISTESQHAMVQILANTQISVETPEDIQTVLHAQDKQNFAADCLLQTPNESQLNAPTGSLEVLDYETKNPQKISAAELQEGRFQVAMTAQQTLNVFGQAIFQIPMETQQASPDDMMDQTHSETIETIHQYQNIQTASADKVTVADTEQESPLVLKESKNSVILHKSQQLSGLLVEKITATEARNTPQAKIQEFSFKSQQEEETLLQFPSDTQLLQISNFEPLVKLNEAKEVTHQILSEAEVQEHVSTQPQLVMRQTSADTQASIETLERMQSLSYPEQIFTDDASDECELNTQTDLSENEIKNVQDELQEETKWKVAVTAQQTPINRTTFPNLGEVQGTTDETDPVETIEMSHQYPNTQETLSNKPTMIESKQEAEKAIQIPNEGSNRVFLTETQKVSHILVEEMTSSEAREMVQEGQYSLSGVKSQTQLLEVPTVPVKVTKSTPDKIVEETAQEAKALTCQNYNISAEMIPKVDAKQIPAETKSIESTVTRMPNVDEKLMYQMTMQTSIDTQQSSTGSDKRSRELPAELQAQRSNRIQMLHQNPVETQLSSDEVQNIQHCQSLVEETELIPVPCKNPHTQGISVEAKEIMEGTGQLYQHPMSTTIEKSVENYKANSKEQTLNISQGQLEMAQMTSKTINYSLPAETIHQYLGIQEGKQSVSDSKQSFVDDASDESELNTLNNSPDNKIRNAQEVLNELQEETKWKVAVTAQQTPIMFDLETFPTVGKAHETVDQAQNVLIETTQIVYEDTAKKDWDTSPNMQEPHCEDQQDTQCYTTAYSRQLSNNSPKQMNHTADVSTATHHIQCSPPIKHQQALLAPNGEDHQQPMTEPDKVTHQFLNEDREVVMTETHCITFTDAMMSYDITHQSSTLPTTTQQISHDQLPQSQLDPEHVSQWSPPVTQQLPDSPMQEGRTEQTLCDIDQSVQTDGPHHTEVDMVYNKAVKFEKVIEQQFSKTAPKLNEPQSVIMHEVFMSSVPTPVTHRIPHEVCHISIESKPMIQQTIMETYQTPIEPDMTFSETRVLSDKVVEQMDQPGGNEEPSTSNAQTTDNVQESLCEKHERVDNKIINQFPLTIHSTPDEVYNAEHQPMSGLDEYEPLKKMSQRPLQQVLFEMPQQIHAKDEGNGSVDQLSMLETKPKISASSQQVLFESPTATDQNLQMLNSIDSAQLKFNVQDQTQKNEPQCIAAKNAKKHQHSFETECTSIEIASPISTTPQISSEVLHSVSVHQGESADDQQIQMLTTEEQEILLNDGTEEVSEAQNKPREANKCCFTFKNDQKIPPFSVEVQELTIEGDNICCQQMAETRPEAQLETQQMAAEKKLQETGLSVLHEISIDYKQKTVETRKSFYKIPTPGELHNIEHLFSIEAKQPLPDNEQFKPQQALFRAQKVTRQVPDKPTQLQPQPNLLPTSRNTVALVETPKVVKTIKMPVNNSIILPVEALQNSVDKIPKANVGPMLVEYDEDVMIVDFTSDQVTTGNFNIITINPHDHLWHHYQLLNTNENITANGEEISTCTVHCCSFHILVKIEKIAQKKKFSPMLINEPLHQCDLQGTRNAINELLLKYM